MVTRGLTALKRSQLVAEIANGYTSHGRGSGLHADGYKVLNYGQLTVTPGGEMLTPEENRYSLATQHSPRLIIVWKGRRVKR